MGTKICSRCGEERDLSFFWVNASYADGYQSWCKPCVNLRTQSAIAFARVDALLTLGGRCQGSECPGGGVTDLRVLVIDHRNGGGIADRAAHGSSLRFYRYVAAHPEGYQALCHNCNHLKRLAMRESRRGEYSDLMETLPSFDPPNKSESLKKTFGTPEGREKQRAKSAKFTPGSEAAMARGRAVAAAIAAKTPEQRAEHARKISEAKRGRPPSAQALANLAKGQSPEVHARAVAASAEKRRERRDPAFAPASPAKG